MATTTNKRKKAVAATIAAAAILLAGTFAWTSISQQALNETIVDINPGGRLHDDFDGTNKDVYVENFNDENDATAVPIYARIRLDQYMEIGPDAGINVEQGTTSRNVKAITGTDSDSNDKSTWVTYIPEEDIENGTVQAQNHWQWKLGNDENNKPFYMPTFNMNKDSLAADVNGTYEGTVEGDIVHYDDNKKYTATTDTKTGTEIVDWDSDTLDEPRLNDYDNGGVTTSDTTPIDSADVLHRENQTHNAEQITSTATVITMDQWIAMGSPVGAYWVYDKDGWAYWAQAIAPGDTTGLFLDGISMNKTPDENWYYGINVVAQFATAGDLRAFDQAAPTGGGGMSDAAKDLMAAITEMGESLTVSGASEIAPGGTAQYSATLKKAGIDAGTPTDTAWSIENIKAPAAAAAEGETETESDPSITVNNTGLVTVDEDVAAGTTFEVKAVAGTMEDTFAVEVIDGWRAELKAATPGTTETATIDGHDWFVLAKEDGKALLQASKPLENKVSLLSKENVDYTTPMVYAGNIMDNYLNSDDANVTVIYESNKEKTIPSFRSDLVSMKPFMTDTTQYDILNYSNAYMPRFEILKYPVVYSEFTAKAWIPTAADFAAITQDQYLNLGNSEDSQPGYSTSYRKSDTERIALITKDMLDIMLANSSSGYIQTRTYMHLSGDSNCYCAVMKSSDGEGYVVEEYPGWELHDVYPMFWVKYAE